MKLREEFSRPRNVVLSLVVGAAALFANCDGNKADLPAPVVKAAPKVSPKVRENTDEVLNGFRRVFRDEESDEPRVTFGPDAAGDLYATEKGLADCIQSEENTCYLKSDFARLFGTSLECFANDWGSFAEPLKITFGGANVLDGYNGMRTTVRVPDGDRIEYEQSPHPGIDPEGAADFYTNICQDALALLKEKPTKNPCIDEPEGEACLDMESSSDWAFDLVPTFEDTFQLLAENGVQVRDGGMNFLSIGFEGLDGTRQSKSFFPKRSYCLEDDGVNPCWKFELSFGGEYTPDELLEKSFEIQETLYEGEEL